MLSQQPGIRLNRPVQHSHPLRRDLRQRAHQQPDHAANLIVRVGCGHHPRRRHRRHHGNITATRSQTPHRLNDAGVRPLLTRPPGHHPEAGGRQLPQQRRRARCQLLRQEQHDLTDLTTSARLTVQYRGRGAAQVRGVIPFRGQQPGNTPMQAHRVRRHRLTAAGDGIQGALLHLPKLTMSGGQRLHRDRMRHHLRENARILVQRPSPRRGNNGARRRPPACPSQRRRGDQLCQAIHRQHRQSRHTRPPRDTPGQNPPSDHTTQVRRHQDTHRSKRVTTLDLANHPAQRLIRRRPVPRPHHRHCRPPDVPYPFNHLPLIHVPAHVLWGAGTR